MATSLAPRRNRGPLRLIAVLVALAVAVYVGGRMAGSEGPLARWFRPTPPQVDHAMVVTELRNVAKLVSTEMTVRDVVTFEQSRFGMRKRALIVVTGRVLAGIDLGAGGVDSTAVSIDHEKRAIAIRLPRAKVLGVEVVESRTWDEDEGLLFQFTPQDRDEIQRRVRAQLLQLGERSGLLPQAERSAQQLLRTLLARDGYTVEVTVSGRPVSPAG